MGRQKQEITKSVEIRVRIEPALKKQYVSLCKRKKQVFSKGIRELIIKELNENQ